MVFRIALVKTFSHGRNRILLWLVLSVIGIVLQYLLHLRNLSDTMKISISLAGSAIIVMVGAFFWHLVVTPATLYVEPRKRSPVEEQRFEAARTATEKLGDDAIKLLRHLRTLGKMVFEIGGPILPSGMDMARASELLRSLKREGIVESENIPIVGIVGRVGNKVLWKIVPEMESAVDDLM